MYQFDLLLGKEARTMDITKLTELMIEHGLVIRAIPHETIGICEERHKEKYPDSVLFYDKKRKCNMIRVTSKNNQGGKFVIGKMSDQSTIVNNWNKVGKSVIFYNTIEEAVQDAIK
ncbi:hypothetical protein D3C74_50380 [compost metagenome]